MSFSETSKLHRPGTRSTLGAAKPLPSAPRHVRGTASASKPLPPKPLPEPPAQLNRGPSYRTTLLIVSGLFVWFLAIVVLLPIIMEREAMIGLNKILREMFGLKKDEL